jgi:uncharacterized membrane protein YbjE (DUF340 family)
MALIFCPECGTQVSDKAQACIKCAFPIAQKINNSVNFNTNQKSFSYQPSINEVNVNNNIVWILAFAPIIGTVLQGFIVGFLFGNNWMYSYNKFWWITLALNILLCHLDEKKLVQDGIDTEKMGSSWLIPVYLYKRAQILNHSPVYLWVWIATFVISFII